MTTEFAAAAWADYTGLRECLPARDELLAAAHERWRAAERERRSLMMAIEQLEAADAA